MQIVTSGSYLKGCNYTPKFSRHPHSAHLNVHTILLLESQEGGLAVMGVVKSLYIWKELETHQGQRRVHGGIPSLCVHI